MKLDARRRRSLPTLRGPIGRPFGVGLFDRQGESELAARAAASGSSESRSGQLAPHLTLSMVHNCTLTVSNGGYSVRSVNPNRKPPARRIGGERSKCRGFSRASRRRLLELIGCIDLRQVGNVFFITLTARAGSMDWVEVERRRRAFEAWLHRLWADYRWFAIWKKEPHANGSPHLHYVVYFLGGLVPNLIRFRQLKDDAWSRICGERSISEAVLIKDKNRGVMYYVAKYCSKPFESQGCGRVWGMTNRERVPLDRESIVVQREVQVMVERELVRLQRSKRARWRFFDSSVGRWSQWMPRGSALGAPRGLCERWGVKTRSWKPAVYRRFKRKIWEEHEDLESGRVDYRRAPDEVESVPPSLHFANAETVRRLIRWAESEVIRRRLEDDLPPF